jgi:hypothetical protein
MKKILLLCVLITFNLTYAFAQAKTTYGNMKALAMMADSDEKKNGEKIWSSACKSMSASKITEYSSNENTILYRINKGGVSSCYYAFDKKTLALKHVRYNKSTVVSLKNAPLISAHILENGDVLYFFNVAKRTDSGKIQLSISYAINDGALQELEKSNMDVKNLRVITLVGKEVFYAKNDAFFGVASTEDGENVSMNIYNNKFEWQYAADITLPKETKPSLFNMVTAPTLAYNLTISNDGKQIYFYDIAKIKKDDVLQIKFYTYDQTTSKLSEKIKLLEEFDIFTQKEEDRYPTTIFFIKNDFAYLAAVSPPKEKQKTDYKGLDGHLILHQLSLPSLEIVSTSRIDLPDYLFEKEKGKINYIEKGSSVDEFDFDFDKTNKTKLNGITIKYAIYEVNHNTKGEYATTKRDGASVYFPLNADGFDAKPFVIPVTLFEKGKLRFSTKTNTYQLKSNKQIEIVALIEGEEKPFYEFKPDMPIFISRYKTADNALIFPTSKGLVRLAF